MLLGKKWEKVIFFINEAWLNVFPFRIMGKNIDSLTKKATFTLKAKKIPAPIILSTEEIIISGNNYLAGLSGKDRKIILDQYQIELLQKTAYIPITLQDANNGECII